MQTQLLPQQYVITIRLYKTKLIRGVITAKNTENFKYKQLKQIVLNEPRHDLRLKLYQSFS